MVGKSSHPRPMAFFAGWGHYRERQIMEKLERIGDAFEFLDEWEDRYNYLADLGGKLTPLPDRFKSPEHQVHGCVSRVWIVIASDGSAPPILRFQADSDTPIIKGIVAILLAAYSGRTAEECETLDADAIFARLGIYDHLSPNRHVGVYAMIEKIRALARTSARLAA